MFFALQTALVSVARDTEHLAVLSGGLTAFGPRLDVVALHLANLEHVLAVAVAGGVAAGAVSALVILALVGRTLLAVVKLPDAEMSLVAGEQVGVDTLTLGHVGVLHQLDRAAFQLCSV